MLTDDKHPCEVCGKVKPDVKYVKDPYDEDVNETVRWTYLCDQCYEQKCDDI